MAKERLFSSEADLVAKFCGRIDPVHWTQYHETAGWDLLLVHNTGVQIGIEAKLGLNAKVLEQALPGHYSSQAGPDFRAVLVPVDGLQGHLQTIARHLGIVVIVVYSSGRSMDEKNRYHFNPSLPDGSMWGLSDWPNWCPGQRCRLPDYVPDVTGGHSAPLQLSEWKIRAIKLLILLERNGSITRADIKALGMSPTRWTDRFNGFLTAGSTGYIRNAMTPDLKRQHPTNWAQIEADFAKWSPGLSLPPRLVGAAS